MKLPSLITAGPAAPNRTELLRVSCAFGKFGDQLNDPLASR